MTKLGSQFVSEDTHARGTPDAPLTTKGDLLTYDTADARIGVGANGQVLTADSTESLGVKWANPASGSVWELVGTWTHSGDVSFVDFDVSGYSAINIIGRLITLSVSGFRAVLVSTDGGSTFYTASGDYKTLSNTGVESNTTSWGSHFGASTTATTFTANAEGINITGTIKRMESNGNPDRLFTVSTDAITDIRVKATAGSFTGGSINIVGLPI